MDFNARFSMLSESYFGRLVCKTGHAYSRTGLTARVYTVTRYNWLMSALFNWYNSTLFWQPFLNTLYIPSPGQIIGYGYSKQLCLFDCFDKITTNDNARNIIPNIIILRKTNYHFLWFCLVDFHTVIFGPIDKLCLLSLAWKVFSLSRSMYTHLNMVIAWNWWKCGNTIADDAI